MAMRGIAPRRPLKPRTARTFHWPAPVQPTQDAPARCLDKSGLAQFLGLSVRSLDRANARDSCLTRSGRGPVAEMGPDPVKRWLRARPKLPGRGGGHGR